MNGLKRIFYISLCISGGSGRILDYKVVLKASTYDSKGGINIEKLTKGVYFISLKEGNEINTYKFMVK